MTDGRKLDAECIMLYDHSAPRILVDTGAAMLYVDHKVGC